MSFRISFPAFAMNRRAALKDLVEFWQHKDPNTRLQKQFAEEYPPVQTQAPAHFEAWLLPSLFQH